MSRSGGQASFPFDATGMFALSRALILILCLGGCGFLRRPDEPVDRSRDSWILASVRDRLGAEPVLAPRDIRVEVDGAIVRLYGNVSGMGEWRCAIRNAQRVPGVLTVVDYLMIERGPRETRCIAAPVPPPEPDFVAGDTTRGEIQRAGTLPAPSETPPVPIDSLPFGAALFRSAPVLGDSMAHGVPREPMSAVGKFADRPVEHLFVPFPSRP